jgi:hypothetical protein
VNHKHTLTFEGDVPGDEMERATVFAHPRMVEARAALLDAFKEAGYPHTASSKVVKPKAAGAARRDRPAAVRPAAE